MKFTLLSLLGLFVVGDCQAALRLTSENFFFDHDPKALVSTVQLVFRSGSLSDPQGKEGLASLAFSALVRGTKTKDKPTFYSAVERLGANIGVDTASSRTMITLESVSANLEKSLALFSEVVLQPRLDEEDIRSLTEEGIANLQQELSNNRSIMKRVFRQAIYAGTPMAIPAQGTISGLKNISSSDLRAYLAQQIRAGNVLVAVSSSLPKKMVKDWLETNFSALPEGNAPALPPVSTTKLKGRHLFLVERSGSSTTEIGIGHEGIPANYPEKETLETANFIFGGGMSSRVFQTLRGKNGWTYGAYSGFQFIETPRKHGSAFMLYTFPQTQFTEQTTLEALKLYEEFLRGGVTKEELSFAQNSLQNSYPFTFASSKARLNGLLYRALDGAPLLTPAEYRKKIQAINQKSLLSSVQKAQSAENLVVVLVGSPEQIAPLAKSIPNLKSVKKITDPMAPL